MTPLVRVRGVGLNSQAARTPTPAPHAVDGSGAGHGGSRV